MFVYYVDLIVLWAFQASAVSFLSLACLGFCVTGFSVIMQPENRSFFTSLMFLSVC